MTFIYSGVIIFSTKLYKDSFDTHTHRRTHHPLEDKEHPQGVAGCNESHGHAWTGSLKYDKLCWHLESSYVWDVIISLIWIIVCNASPGLS